MAYFTFTDKIFSYDIWIYYCFLFSFQREVPYKKF